MVTTEVRIMYDKIVKATIIKLYKVFSYVLKMQLRYEINNINMNAL